MHGVIYVLFRRLRVPLIALLSTYAVSVLGLVLVPGVDPNGDPWHMSFFHAFYFVSFMGSTIGLGEVPYPFSNAQRLWTLFAIYATVIAWLYAIGTLLGMFQDKVFWRTVRHTVFVRGVRRIAEPFYIVCGYGDTGSLLVQALAERRIRAVVIDIDQDRIDALDVEGFAMSVPGLCANATDLEVLRAAGLLLPGCAGVLALTNSDQVNLSIAISAKLMVPALPVISRAEFADTAANLRSFGTDHVINAYDEFADGLAMAIHSPSLNLLDEWLTSTGHGALERPVSPPRGTWVLCGYGRFGKAVRRALSFEGIEVIVVEKNPEAVGAPEGTVRGRGTEAVTLREARIEDAVGVIAGTENDADNLSILITAREIKEELFTLARQNLRRNGALFESAWLNMVMQPGRIIARRILAYITTPLLADFLRRARVQDDQWANVLVSRIAGTIGESAPHSWHFALTAAEAPAVAAALAETDAVRLGDLLTDPRDCTQELPAIPLLLDRNGEQTLLPDPDMELRLDDRILVCGRPEAETHMTRLTRNHNLLDYVRYGVDRPSGYVWRWIASRLQDSSAAGPERRG